MPSMCEVLGSIHSTTKNCNSTYSGLDLAHSCARGGAAEKGCPREEAMAHSSWELELWVLALIFLLMETGCFYNPPPPTPGFSSIDIH